MKVGQGDDLRLLTPRVLIADGEPSQARQAGLALRDAGYSCEIFREPAEALAQRGRAVPALKSQPIHEQVRQRVQKEKTWGNNPWTQAAALAAGAFDERETAALAYTRAIAWDPEQADDALWRRLRTPFSEAQIVELGSFVSLTAGAQRFVKTLDLGHREVLGDGDAGLAAHVAAS